MDLIVLVCGLSTSLILLAAGADHAAGQRKLRSRLRAHGVFGSRGVWMAAVSLPLLELLAAVGGLSAVAVASQTGFVASLVWQTALYWAFAGYLAAVVRSGNAGVPCGCGPAEVPVGRSAIARAIGLGMLSGAAAISLVAFDFGPIALHADARGLVACAAGVTLATLLVILAPARSVEPSSAVQSGPTIGSA